MSWSSTVRRRVPALLSVALVAAAVLASGAGSAVGAPVSGVARPMLTAATVPIEYRGNGHGHGMSQYGARGAALAGLTAAQILAFYYPGTTLTTLPASTIRVLLSGTGTTTTVVPSPGLRITGMTTSLPTPPNISRYRLIAAADGTTLTLQRLTAGWVTVTTGLPDGTAFSRPQGYLRVFLTDGTSTVYRGSVAALRNGSGVQTINTVSLEGYAAGVTPREMPASWSPAAVQAQAIAARTYGRQAVESHASSSAWDICDTTQCQVYGGQRHYDASGQLLWSEDLDALTGDSGEVLTSAGHAIFAQFSASNGGYEAAGSMPYLVGQADPYDNAASGDPYLDTTADISTTPVAQAAGLIGVNSITITGRDGNGTWGGRVTSAVVTGPDANGMVQHVAMSGFDLQDALNLPTTLFTVLDTNRLPIGYLDSVTVTAPHTVTIRGWVMDPDHTDLPGLYALSIDHVLHLTHPTTVPRPDVQRAFQTVGDTFGVGVTLTMTTGSHPICLYGIDRDDGTRVLLGCSYVTVPA